MDSTQLAFLPEGSRVTICLTSYRSTDSRSPVPSRQASWRPETDRLACSLSSSLVGLVDLQRFQGQQEEALSVTASCPNRIA